MAAWDAFAKQLPDLLRPHQFALGSIVRNLGIDEQHLIEHLAEANEQDHLQAVFQQIALASEQARADQTNADRKLAESDAARAQLERSYAHLEELVDILKVRSSGDTGPGTPHGSSSLPAPDAAPVVAQPLLHSTSSSLVPDQSAAPDTPASLATASSSVAPVPSVPECRAMRKDLKEQLPAYKDGMVFSVWADIARKTVARYAKSLPGGDACSVLRKAIDAGLTKHFECNKAVQDAEDVEVLLAALLKVFGPDHLQCQQQLASMHQAPGQSATQFQLQGIYKRSNCPFPQGPELFPLLQRFCEPYYANTHLTLNAMSRTGDGLTIHALETAASNADTMVQKQRYDEAQRSEGGWQPSNTRGYRKPHASPQPQQHAAAAQFERGSQRDRSHGSPHARPHVPLTRYQARRGPHNSPAYQRRPFQADRRMQGAAEPDEPGVGALTINMAGNCSSRPNLGTPLGTATATPARPVASAPSMAASLSAHSASASSGANGMLPEAVQQLLDQGAAVNASRMRPRRAEAADPVPMPDRAFTAPQRQLPQVYSRPQASAASRVANIAMPLTLSQMVELQDNPNWQAALPGIRGLLGESAEVHVVDMPAEPSATSTTSAPVASSAVHSSGPAYPSVGISIPATTPPELAQPRVQHASFAASVQCEMISKYVVSMPTACSSLDTSGADAPALRRRVAVDTGAGVSLISEDQFNRDEDILVQHGARVVHIEPITIGGFAGQGVCADKIVQSARLAIGPAVYEVDLLVVPGSVYAYLLGSDFLITYDGQAQFYGQRLRLGVEQRSLLPGKTYQHDYASVPLYYQGIVHRYRTRTV